MPVDELRSKIEVFAEALDQLSRLDIPTLASVQGGCAGGGLELAERVGRSRAAELAFLSEKTSAAQFYAWNVVNWVVVDDAALEQVARDLAMRLASGPTRAYAATKALWRLQAESGERAARKALYEHSMPLFET